jgi:F-type H+-transporting ATPase subunit delta
MAEATTIARPYAEAVFRIADQNGRLPAWSETLTNMALVAETPEMQQLIGNPQVTRAQLADLFIAACKGLDGNGMNLVRLLVDNGRLVVVPQIRDLFEELKREREGMLDAQIRSAFPMNEADTRALVVDLERKFGRRVKASVEVDPELIGGVMVVVGDQVIDGSVRARLAAMSAALKS